VSLAPGTKLGAHEIVELIGEGGMGQVYRARDPRLDRDVAIKVLPELLAGDPERVARFRREAKLLASLSHSNVAAIHGFDEEGERRFLVMELVDGDALDQRLRMGPLEPTAALEIARQVAEGLEAAHEKGIIHRDLKPANVKVRPDGQVKVLDFGLAKALEEDGVGGPLGQSPTITSGYTHDGVILGTAAYMSPEQARGRAVDARADVWAFGALLYEMLTAKRAFPGETPTDCLGAVLHAEPDWTALPAETPGAAQLLLRRCLTKDPRRRLHSIADARIELESCLADPSGTSTLLLGQALHEKGAGGGRPARGLVLAVGLGLLAVGLVLGAWAGPRVLGGAGHAAHGPVKLDLGVALDAADGETTFALSPDGSVAAFTKGGRLWVRELDNFDAIALEGTDGAQSPFWSPDGTQLAYFSGPKLMRIPAGGGRASPVANLPREPTGGNGGCWGEDGRIVFSLGSTGLFQVPAVGGDARDFVALAEGEADFHEPHLLPGGRGVVFVVHPEDAGPNLLVVQSGEQRTELLDTGEGSVQRPVWDDSGHLLFRRSGGAATTGLWALPFSLDRLEAMGEPFLVAADASAGSVAANGALLHVHRPVDARGSVIAFTSADGSTTERTDFRAWYLNAPSVSPDGTKLVFTQLGEGGLATGAEMWLHDLVRGTRVRLADAQPASWPMVTGGWTADGSHLLISRFEASSAQTLIVPADGSRPPRPLAEGLGENSAVGGLTRDGREALIGSWGGDDDPFVFWLVPLDGEGEPRRVLQGLGEQQPNSVALSPDNQWLAVVAQWTGRREVYLTRFPSGEGRWPVSVDGGAAAKWSADGSRLFFVTGQKSIAVVTVDEGPRLSRPEIVVEEAYIDRGGGDSPTFAVMPDGRFVHALPARSQAEAEPPSLKLVLDWYSEFRRD
jgi:Tol biopolymer transport system component